MKVATTRWLTIVLVVACAQLGAAQTPSRELQKGREITDSIGLKMMLIPAGEFMMGGQESAEDLVKAFAAYKRKPDFFADEYPRHHVRITKPFYLGKYEVTVGQYRQFVNETGYKTEAQRDGKGGWGYNADTGMCEGRDIKYNWLNPGYPQTDEHPIVDVTWNDAMAFCDWLSRKEGKTYRLPTEAEWEFACRAGTATRYNNGDDPDALPKVANVIDGKGRTTFPHVQELELLKGDQARFTTPVGSFTPNAFGLYDMHGNAWEWCSDWHGDDYYAQSPEDDPAGPDSGCVRVRRGGGWNSFPLWARASFRNWNTPGSRCVNLGFRVAADEPSRDAVTILFGGDVMLDGGPGHAVVHGADPFAKVAPILRSADLIVCNLECVIAEDGQQVLKPYTFRGVQESIPFLKCHFSAVCLANNHTGDYGKDAFTEQLATLDRVGLPYFGGGRNCREAHRPTILQRNGLRVALLGYNDCPPRSFAATEKESGTAWLVEKDMIDDIRTARERDKADVVIPFLHWGEEMAPEPDQDQRELARRLIDAGASAIVGGHPHVVQPIEIYKGHPIVYSLGNFVFDYFPVDPPVWTGWLVKLTIHRSGEIGVQKFAFEIDPAGIPQAAVAEK